MANAKDAAKDGSGAESAEPSERARSRYRSVFWFGLAGLCLTAAVIVSHLPLLQLRGASAQRFVLWMSASFLIGLLLRGARRRAFFGARLSRHKAVSFDAIFQGAILVNPQLPYPSVEAEFISRYAGLSPELVSPWFQIRATSALSIPLILGSVTSALAGLEELAGAFLAAVCGWLAYRAYSLDWRPWGRSRFVIATLLGMAAAVGEGLAFLMATAAVDPSAAGWQSFLLYSVLLTGFELSPLPLALGVLEVLWLALYQVPNFAWPGLLMPLAYRAWRAVPILLLTAFYLPRYKMSFGDLFDPRLAWVLSSIRRRTTKQTMFAGSAAPLLSVVLPAYNEAERLPRYLPGVLSFCERLKGGAEVLVVDDGSSDGTAAYVESVALRNPAVRLIRQGTNQGKGRAVRRGVAEAKGAYILFADSDGATPIGEAAKLLSAARAGAEVVIGSRKATGQNVHRERSLFRGLMGSIFYRVTNLLAVPGVADTQCGFKLFARSAAERIFPLLREAGWAFDVELLFLAQKFGMTIEEVPVNWSAVGGSKVRARDAIKMFTALLRIRRRASGLTADTGTLA